LNSRYPDKPRIGDRKSKLEGKKISDNYVDASKVGFRVADWVTAPTGGEDPECTG